MKDIMRRLAILYANQLGTVWFFVFFVTLVIVGVVAAIVHKLVFLVAVVTFLSQTVIQLWSLPAIQLQSIEAEKQRQADHAALMDLVKVVHEIAVKEGVEDNG